MSAAQGPPARALRAIAEELERGGVRDVVICPGSRSTPLALALRAAGGLRCWVHLDERAGAYFALGAAKASRRPTAILATSGTAAVNFAPAVVEARHARVPLLLLTADRPPELRDRASAQSIDQDHLYGRFAKWYAELPVPEPWPPLEAHARGVVGRAMATALAAPSGPVHLNLPFREPLLPDGPLVPAAEADVPPFARVVGGVRGLAETDLEELADGVAGAHRGLIVCGPLDAPGFPAAVARLASAMGAPVLADALANVRLGPHDRSHVVARVDALVRSSAFRERHVPDLVLRFGATPTSKALLELLREQAAPQVVVDDGGWTEPTGLPLTMVDAEPVALATWLADALAARTRPSTLPWLDAWQTADRAADAALRRWLEGLDEPFEGAVGPAIVAALPEGAIVVAGNSLPVRDLDAFLPADAAAIRCLGNRGASGIDGLVSTALGAAAVQDGPVVAVVGDLSFIHDLNAIVAGVRLGIDATIVLVNNDGGGIFSFLPQAAADRPDLGLPEHYEELFGTPHGLDFGPLARALGAQHRLLGHDAITPAIATAVQRGGIWVLELRSDRRRNVALHRAALAAAHAALEAPA